MGRLGINCIAGVCARIGWIWRETSCSDVGFDGEAELVEGEDATGQIMKVQGKAGQSSAGSSAASDHRLSPERKALGTQ